MKNKWAEFACLLFLNIYFKTHERDISMHTVIILLEINSSSYVLAFWQFLTVKKKEYFYATIGSFSISQ